MNDLAPIRPVTRTWAWTAFVAAVAAVIVVALAALLPVGIGTLLLAVFVVVFVVVWRLNPEFWLRRLAGTCFLAALGMVAMPKIVATLTVPSLGKILVEHGADPWLAVAFLIAGIILAGLEWSRLRAQTPSGDVLAASASSSAAPATPVEQDRRAIIRDSESSQGGALADDRHGQGALIERTKVSGNLVAKSSAPKKK